MFDSTWLSMLGCHMNERESTFLLHIAMRQACSFIWTFHFNFSGTTTH